MSQKFGREETREGIRYKLDAGLGLINYGDKNLGIKSVYKIMNRASSVEAE